MKNIRMKYLFLFHISFYLFYILIYIKIFGNHWRLFISFLSTSDKYLKTVAVIGVLDGLQQEDEIYVR